ncbi:MAG: hypothetical protein Q9186_007539 [Xanthomendoza sp. 1 TL-2023]
MQITYYPPAAKIAPPSSSPGGYAVDAADLDNLPVEIIEMIMVQVYDLNDLCSFVQSYPRAFKIYLSEPRHMVSRHLHNSNLGNQIQRLLLTTLLTQRHRVQQNRVNGNARLDNLVIDEILDEHLKSAHQDIESSMSSLVGIMGPFGFLQSAARVSKHITEAEESLISTMLLKTNLEIQAAQMTRQQRNMNMETRPEIQQAEILRERCLCNPDRATSQASHTRPASATEVHRIRRAFYRLWLFFELCHHPSQVEDNWTRTDLFDPLTIWELEEMDCAYYHLRRQSGIWRRECPHCSTRLLPDKIPRHQKCECEWLSGEPIPPRYVPALCEHAIFWKRRRKWWNVEGLITDWPSSTRAITTLTTVGDKPSAGWSFVNQNENLRKMDTQEWHTRERPMGCFLDWGYCMWDLERMQAWHLVDDPDHGVGAELDWWTDGQSRDEYCAHCPDYYAHCPDYYCPGNEYSVFSLSPP